ncbi:tRNA-dihydrouridine synthase, partial [Priestia megaterium]|uniref:oxidoreductase n=1 Tax=Priestia megaterium TaxID=1404 RepID=UPI003EBBC631
MYKYSASYSTTYCNKDCFLSETGATLAALAKKYSKLPVIANGSLHDPEKAKEIIEKGEADVITLGRGALANHDWANKVKNGEQPDEFVPEK